LNAPKIEKAKDEYDKIKSKTKCLSLMGFLLIRQQQKVKEEVLSFFLF
jgi:chaperonin cofactor prefoldin